MAELRASARGTGFCATGMATIGVIRGPWRDGGPGLPGRHCTAR